MPSTYTSRLRLELQATGENRTTWGINANQVFSRIEEAIAGMAQVAMGDANSSALIQIPGREDFKYVVMPMRI